MNIEIHYDSEDTGGSGEWAALYVDGRLVTIGDSYVTEARAFEAAGVEVVHDSAFMRGQDQRSGAAQTLAEVREYAAERDRRKTEADRLRLLSAELLARAAKVEASGEG